MEENERKKKIYERINFWSCAAALVMTVVGNVLTIISEFGKMDFRVYLILSTIIWAVALLAGITMIISWAKLRKIKRSETKNGAENAENK